MINGDGLPLLDKMEKVINDSTTNRRSYPIAVFSSLPTASLLFNTDQWSHDLRLEWPRPITGDGSQICDRKEEVVNRSSGSGSC